MISTFFRILHIDMKRWMILWVFIGACVGLTAQQGNNPFEIVPNLPAEVREANAQEAEAAKGTNNPFEIVPQLNEPAQEAKDIDSNNPFEVNQAKKTTLTPRPKPAPAPRTTLQQEDLKTQTDKFLFIAVLSLLGFLTFCITLFRGAVKKVYEAFLNDNLLRLLQRENAGIAKLPYQILYLLFFITIGLLIYLLVNRQGYYPENPAGFLMSCIAGVAVFFLAKHLILKVLATVFPIQKEVHIYSFSVLVFSIVLGILLIPVVAIIAFASPGFATMAVYFAYFLIVGILLYRALRGLLVSTRFFSFNKFHFLLYICTVEVAPVLIIIKLIQHSF